MPDWVGRLPKDVGYPAGGSLNTDEYKALVLVYGPVIVSFTLFLVFMCIIQLQYILY